MMKTKWNSFRKFLSGHKRWWVFFLAVVGICLVVMLFGQSSSLTSFIYVFF